MGKPNAAVATSRKWAVDERARNIHRIAITLERVGDEQRVLLVSDVHWDNPKCLQGLYRQHLDEARAHDAPVVDNGDFFCAMGGKWDRRSNKADLRPEHQTADYLDALVRTAADFHEPYLDLLTVRGDGNHEVGIRKHHETSLNERLVERLRMRGAPNVYMGGYSGWVVFDVTHNRTRRKTFKLHYFHGSGGGGPVTRGVIQTNRQAVYLADADIAWQGHTHDHYILPIARIRLNQDCTTVEHTRQVHCRTASYKQEYADGYGGWHVERGGAPKPIGGMWLTFKYLRDGLVDFDLVEAK